MQKSSALLIALSFIALNLLSCSPPQRRPTAMKVNSMKTITKGTKDGVKVLSFKKKLKKNIK